MEDLPLAAASRRLKQLAAGPPKSPKPRRPRKPKPASAREPEPQNEEPDEALPAGEPEIGMGLTAKDRQWVQAVVEQIKARAGRPA